MPDDKPLLGIGREERALCLAARTVLDETARQRLSAALTDRVDLERLWSLAHLHEVGPLLARTMPEAGEGAIPELWLARATKRRHVTLGTNARLADALLPTLRALADAGLDAMPVKGLVVADQLYGDLGARPCADLDVLVRPGSLPAARAVLRGLGFAQREVPRYKALVHQFHDPAWERIDGGSHVRLELHWALWADSARRMGTDGLWDRSVPATLLGQPIRILSPEDTLLHLAIHRTRSALRLRWVVDVAELLRRHAATLDWEAFLARAAAARGRTASWAVLRLAHDLLDAPVPDEVLQALDPGPLKRAILERTCGRRALFRRASHGDVRQQPHLAARAFEEDGLGRIAGSLAGSASRPIREALHDAGLVRVDRRMA